MKRLSILFAVTAVAVWFTVDAVRELFSNETRQYFAAEPRRLLYVATVGVSGGLLMLGFNRLGSRVQRNVRVVTWGATASASTAFVVYFWFCFASLFTFIVESGGGFIIQLVFVWLLYCGIIVYLWFEFYRALKAKVSQ